MEKKMVMVKRPPGWSNFPLVDFFYNTGEPVNPWRCGNCLTLTQRKISMYAEIITLPHLHICCRKCGMDICR